MNDHIIKNFDALASSEARRTALAIAEAGYAAIKTDRVISSLVRLESNMLRIGEHIVDLSDIEHLYVIGVGKSAYDAAVSLERILSDRISDGVVIDVSGGSGLKHIRFYEGSHPFPSAVNVEYTKNLIDLIKPAGERDVVIAIISGGGSTLLCQPRTHTVEQETALVQFLFKAGATIQELNTVRKHLSLARGGNIATSAYPARLFSLIFSDVPGDDIGFIASGPTVRDNTSVEDARAVLSRYGAEQSGFSFDHLFETPKDEALFSTTANILALTNTTALEAMATQAKALGFDAKIVETKFQGEAREIASRITNQLHNALSRSVLLFGGESTVTITGNGKGGRNQELVLAAAKDLRDGEVIVSCGSDGRDNSDFAGAIADAQTKLHAQEKNLDIDAYLQNNDSTTFFHNLCDGNPLSVGYTGSNVADLVIALKV